MVCVVIVVVIAHSVPSVTGVAAQNGGVPFELRMVPFGSRMTDVARLRRRLRSPCGSDLLEPSGSDLLNG